MIDRPKPPLEEESRADRLVKLFVHLVGHRRYEGYIVAHVDGQTDTITCLRCGMTSFQPRDIAQKYCGHCHVFHEDQR
jgi:hypothetical protein